MRLATTVKLSSFLVLLIGLSWLFSLASQSPAVPYNIRELFGAGPPLLSGLAVAGAILFAFGPPASFGILLMRLPVGQLVWIPAGLILHAAVTYFLLRAVVPLESIHDLVGTPVLGWNGELERLLRFIALFGGFSLLLAGGSALWVAERNYRFGVFWRWLVLAALLLPVCYWAVVSAAATDNLVELLTVGWEGGYGLFLAGWILSLAIGGAVVSARVAGFFPSWGGVFALLLICLVLGYMFANLATNQDIDKYGNHFSALSFLLSPDRAQYMTGEVLFYRYLFAHLFFQALLAIAQYPVWLWLTVGRPVDERAGRSLSQKHSGTNRPASMSYALPAATQAAAPTVAEDGRVAEADVEERYFWPSITLFYLLFVIYGSLVPLDYYPIPQSEAWRRFGEIPYLDLGIGSRADWVANILLFIPLSFLWLGLIWPQGRARRIAASLLVLLIAMLFSMATEFMQLYFPQRTVSQNDIQAESLGAVLGILLWWWRGPLVRNWVASWRQMREKKEIAEYILWAYLAVLFLYNVMPLDLTISPVEIYHKWQGGKVNLIPFAFPMGSLAELAYGLISDVAIWIPVSLLWVLSGKKRPLQAWYWAVAAALTLEFLQLFVFSRVSDTTDLFTAAVGAAIGVWIAATFRGYRLAANASGSIRQLWFFLAMIAWVVVLMVVFWYPFEFQTDRVFLRKHFAYFFAVPFNNYYFGTEFRAITELLHKLLFFAPLGVLLALSRIGLQPGIYRTLNGFYSAGIIILIPFLIEIVQVALPQKSPDVTDWVLEMIGGVVGFSVTLAIARRLRST